MEDKKREVNRTPKERTINESCFNCRGTPNRNVDSDKVYCWDKQKWVYEFRGCEEYRGSEGSPK